MKFHKLFFKQTNGYLLMDEMTVDWSRAKQLPLKIMRKDHLIRRCENEPLKDYREYSIMTHVYNNDFNIFEAKIRQLILHDDIEINDNQLDRICNPVLSDNNKNLLHHLSYRRI